MCNDNKQILGNLLKFIAVFYSVENISIYVITYKLSKTEIPNYTANKYAFGDTV